MPLIPPDQLVHGHDYIPIRRANPGHKNGQGTPHRFNLLTQRGWPKFESTPTRGPSIWNPNVFNFYNIYDPLHGIKAPGAGEGAVAPGSGGKRKGKSRKMKRRTMKKRKTLRRK